MPDKKSLIKKYQSKQKEQKIIELLNQGEANYVEIAREVGVSVQYVRETIKAELASASSPQEILEYREEIGSVLSAQTPRLTKRAVRQANRQERLEKQYDELLEQEEQGLQSYTYLYDHYILEGLEPEQADIQARQDRRDYQLRRDELRKEMAEIAKLTDQHYTTLNKHAERVSKLYGLDLPTTSISLIHRSDEIKITLEQEIKANAKKKKQQKEIEAEIEEAEVIEDDA